MNTIVLLHGMLQLPRAWDAVAKELRNLAPTARVETPLLPGHGPNPWGLDARSFDEAADLLAARLPREVDLLAGYSLGARLALAVVARHPRCAKRVVAIGAQLGLRDTDARTIRQAWEDACATLAEERGVPALVDRWEKLPVFRGQERLSASDLAGQRSSRESHDATGVAWALRTLGTGRMPDLRRDLFAVADRVTLVTGAQDERFSMVAQEAHVELGLERITVPEAGHNVPLERPGDIAAILAMRLPSLSPSLSHHEEPT